MRLATLTLLFLGLALALGPGDPQYGQYRVSNVDSRISQLLKLRLPFVEVVDAKAYDNCKDKQGQAYYNCLKDHTWAVPYSTLAATQEKARLIRKAWQRFEERYYWHVISRLNNPAFYVAYCVAGFRGGDLNPPLPPAKVSVDLWAIPQDVPGDSQFRDRLLQAMGRLDPAAAGSHALDVYYPLPQIPKEDFCDDLSLWLLPIMYIPGFCIDIPQIGFSWCTPGYYEDQPLWFNESEAQQRVNDGIANAVRKYYPEYLADVARVLNVPTVPTSFNPDTWHVYAPYPWKTHLLNGGAVAAPVVRDIKDPATTASNILAEVQDIYSAVMKGKGMVPATLQPSYVSYYAQSFLGLANYPGLSAIKSGVLSLLQGVDQTAFSLSRYALEVADKTEKLQNRRGYFTEDPRTGAPGVFPFEEVKRWFPIGSLPVQERFGYTSWFLAWNQMEATIIPTPKDAMGAFGLLQRVIVYWWVPVRVKITLIPTPPFISVTGSLDIPKPKPVPPYVLPFAGERTYWGWENVPEGYPIPKIKGRPLLPQGADYSILLRR